MEKIEWNYERLRDDGRIEYCPKDDMSGKITGHKVYGLRAWFDEHPEERKRLGWIKHIQLTHKEIKEQYPHNPMTHFIMVTTKPVDEYTVEDEYHIVEKSEEMLWFEELQSMTWGENIVTIGPDEPVFEVQ